MADLPYRIVIGLEVHVQLLTRTKLFCGCSTQFGLPPNSATCPVCIGMPGVLPVMNRRAFELALQGRPGPQLPDRRASPSGTARTTTIPTCPRTIRSASTTCRSATTAGWRSRRPAARQADRHHPRPPGRGRRQDAARRDGRRPRQPGRSQPRRHAAAGDRQPARPVHARKRPRPTSKRCACCCASSASPTARCRKAACAATPTSTSTSPQPDGAFAATPIVEVKNLNSFRAVEQAMKYEAERQYEELINKLATGRWTPLPETKKVGADGRAVYKIGQMRADAAAPVEVAKATSGWDEARGRTWAAPQGRGGRLPLFPRAGPGADCGG